MRLFAVALLAIAALGAASFHPARGSGPRPLILLVHGRGQLGQDTAELRRDWKRDLDSSLKLVGMPALRDDDVRLAWYADILDPESDSLCDVPPPSEDSLSFGEVARGFLTLLTNAVPSEESREVRGLTGDLLYVLDASKRCAAERRVGTLITEALREKRPVVVVAYSLGSLVTYGHLQRSAPRDSARVRLITLGSPLGVRVIREMIFGADAPRLRMPPALATWENVYDPDDFLSAPLEGLVSAVDRATHTTERDDPHNFERYLRDPATGAAVMRALCGATKNELAGCAAR